MDVPALIAIDHDDYHADLIGTTADGRQFFITTPFEPGGDEFVSLYIFDAAGQLLEARIDNFGSRATLDNIARRAKIQEHRDALGAVTMGRIEIAPFSVERFGTRFGLIPALIDADEGSNDGLVVVELLPGNYMAFFAPWDSGEYDT